MKDLEKYIKDGITITKIDDGYRVFTIPTQWFEIKDLGMLTPAVFERAIKSHELALEFEDKLRRAAYAEIENRLTADEIKKILEDNMTETDFAYCYDDEYYGKMTELLGESEEVLDTISAGDKIVVRFFKEHGIYIMVEGWEMSSCDYEFDSGFIWVIPDHKVTQTFIPKKVEDKKDDYPF